MRENCNKIFEEEVNESDLSDHISSDDNETEYIPPTPLQKKTVKRKIFTSNANKERQSATSIERDSEKGSEINIEEKDDNSMEKDVDRDSEGLVRDSDDSDSSHKTTPQKAKKIHSVRFNFQKHYKGPKRYMPGTGYSYKFENVENEKAKKIFNKQIKKEERNHSKRIK